VSATAAPGDGADDHHARLGRLELEQDRDGRQQAGRGADADYFGGPLAGDERGAAVDGLVEEIGHDYGTPSMNGLSG
jgi:hypothetical protein